MSSVHFALCTSKEDQSDFSFFCFVFVFGAFLCIKIKVKVSLRFIDLCAYVLESTEKFHVRHPFSFKISIKKFKGFSLARATARTCNYEQFNVVCFPVFYCGIIDT